MVRLWDVEIGHCLRVLEGHAGGVYSVSWSDDGGRALSGSMDNTVRLWDMETGRCIRVFEGHVDIVNCVLWSVDGGRALSGSNDKTVRLWDVETGRCLRVLEGHAGTVTSVSWTVDGRLALSSSMDKTVRLWDVETGRCLRVLEGHTSAVASVSWSVDRRRALSGSMDNTVRLWDVETGRCLRVLEGHAEGVMSVSWSVDGTTAFSCAANGVMRVWNLRDFVASSPAFGPLPLPEGYAFDARPYWEVQNPAARPPLLTEADAAKQRQDTNAEVPCVLPQARGVGVPDAPEQRQYTNAKVLLVGESGAGKTGLSRRLVLNDWQPSDSTVGAWATHWKLPASSGGGVEREIWLWDFGGQADQRLIHQLYMDETALAVLVFDGQKEDLFETLGQWDRDLTRASRQDFAKLLVAGRVDAGGLRVSRNQVVAFANERGYAQFLETSAKANICCEELRQAILEEIRWENIPWRSSPLLFKRLKEEIVRL
jgi:small GTP-binding protein